MKYILISGGVISGIGKGVITSSIGILMKKNNYDVTVIKIDPYLNIDAGTMSPYEHGEVFVLNDGGEVDLDLGNYERSLNIQLTKDNNITTGKIYQSIINKERKGDYLGKTVQIIPHVYDEIVNWIEKISLLSVNNNNTDICLIELGGTIGEPESTIFIEALSQLKTKIGPNNFIHVHVTLIPTVNNMDQKTKPTQISIRKLNKRGIPPDFILCRCSHDITKDIKYKISSTCNIDEDSIISCQDVKNTILVPKILELQDLDKLILFKFMLGTGKLSTFYNVFNSICEKWLYINKLNNKIVKIGIVGKYNKLKDSYISIIQSLYHSCLYNNCNLELIWISSDDLEDIQKDEDRFNVLNKVDAILIPGGFGIRGSEGKIFAAKYCRENNIPYLGICFGMQIAAIEFARNILSLNDSTSEEFDIPSDNKIIIKLPISNENYGGTMKLGSRKCQILENSNSILYQSYEDFNLISDNMIVERFRHRYAFNMDYIELFNNNGFKSIVMNLDNNYCEALELINHKFYVCVQYHPEFNSSYQNPSPVFVSFISSILN